MDAKLDKILDTVLEIKETQDKQGVHLDYLKQTTADHSKHIDNYKADRVRVYTFSAVVGVVIGFLKDIFFIKH